MPDNQPYPLNTFWTYNSRRHPEFQPTSTLALRYELSNSTISDDHAPDETHASLLWHTYVNSYGNSGMDYGYPPGVVHIHWFVTGAHPRDPQNPFEGAPFQTYPQVGHWLRGNEDFLTHFTWPEEAITNERLNWARLPVLDAGWRDGDDYCADKGGFIQEATGWKPAPYQSTVNLAQLAQAAGLAMPPPPSVGV